MQRDRVIMVLLRRPKRQTECPNEMRSDPFWEFGSFGLTTCHSKNLMHLDSADSLDGSRLAFAQGGKSGTRLVFLTPPIKAVPHRNCVEAKWVPAEMPFRYSNAPILVSNKQASDFPEFAATTRPNGRTSIEGQFASNFRSRKRFIENDSANELINIYTYSRKIAPDSVIAKSYLDAMPWHPPKKDHNRRKTYDQLLKKAGKKQLAKCDTGNRSTCCNRGNFAG